MRHPDDPARLVDDPNAPAPLAEALRAARGTAPDRNRLAALSVALGIPVPPALVPPPVVPPALVAAAVAGAGGVKLAITGIAAIGAAAAVAVVGFGVGRGHAPAPARPVPAAIERIAPRAPEPPADFAAPVEEPSTPASAPHRRHHTRPGPAAPVAVEEPAAPPPETPTDAASRLRDEAALVQRAERMLDPDPAGALRLTDERRRRFPTGVLDQEAEVVAIDALLRLGRRAEAATRARIFEAAHAGSLHARRIKHLMRD